MNVQFTNREYADIIFMYGFCNGNATAAAREYAIQYPGRRHPNRAVFVQVFNRLADTGSVNQLVGNRIGRPIVIGPNIEDQILNHTQREPTISTRRLSLIYNVSHVTVWKILNRNGLYPYHHQPVQDLGEIDNNGRLFFCEWLRDAVQNNPDLLNHILWTDEASFTKDGVVNFHNLHSWAEENPHEIRPSSFQRRFSVNVWAGILGANIIGPYILPPRLTGPAYLNFLQNQLGDLLEDVPLHTRARMWYQHDGAPAHYALPVRQELNLQFPQRNIGRGCFVAWPSRSPDLTPCDFFLWGNMKRIVYETVVENRQQLIERIMLAADQSLEHLRNIPESMTKRLELCMRNEGGHFEQFL